MYKDTYAKLLHVYIHVNYVRQYKLCVKVYRFTVLDYILVIGSLKWTDVVKATVESQRANPSLIGTSARCRRASCA